MKDFPELNYLAFGNQITLSLGNKRRFITEISEERLEEIKTDCKKYAQYPTERLYNKLMEIISPNHVLEKHPRLKVTENGVCTVDSSIPMPGVLESKLIDSIENDEEVDFLINFWYWCLLNPNKTARDGFFQYVRDFGITITKRGYAVLYKAVNKQDRNLDEQLDEYVSKHYLRVTDLGFSAYNFTVYKGVADGEYYVTTNAGNLPQADQELEEIGNLGDLHNNVFVDEDNRLTLFKPSRSGKYGTKIRLGEAVTMPREECDPDISNACSYGLHVGSHKYVSSFGSGMDTILAVLVNPRDIVALPKYDHSKIRTCRYFPYAVIQRKEGYWEELESRFVKDDFLPEETKELSKALQELRSSDLVKEEYLSQYADMSEDEIEKILENRLNAIH